MASRLQDSVLYNDAVSDAYKIWDQTIYQSIEPWRVVDTLVLQNFNHAAHAANMERYGANYAQRYALYFLTAWRDLCARN